MSVPTIPVPEPAVEPEPPSEAPAKAERAPLADLLPAGTLRLLVAAASLVAVVASFVDSNPDSAAQDFRLVALAAMRDKWPCQD